MPAPGMVEITNPETGETELVPEQAAEAREESALGAHLSTGAAAFGAPVGDVPLDPTLEPEELVQNAPPLPGGPPATSDPDAAPQGPLDDAFNAVGTQFAEGIEGPPKPTSKLASLLKPTPTAPLADPLNQYPGAPAGSAEQTTTSETQFPVSPEERKQALNTAQDTRDATALSGEKARQEGERAQLIGTAQRRAIEHERAQEALRFKQAQAAENERLQEEIAKEPIDEKGFWGDTGKSIAAILALAMSGFVQGVRGGDDGDQILSFLERSVDKHIKRQQARKDSRLNRLAKKLGSLEAAIAVERGDVARLSEARLDAESKIYGLAERQRGATDMLKANLALERARSDDAVNAQSIGNVVTRQVATPAQTPHMQMLRDRTGGAVTPEAYSAAIDPQKGGLSQKIRAADELTQIQGALKELVEANGGRLPSTLALNPATSPWVAKLATSWGVDVSDTTQQQQLMARVTLLVKQALGSSKIYDSDKEGASLTLTVDSATTPQILEGVDNVVGQAVQSKNAVLQQYGAGAEQELEKIVREGDLRSRGFMQKSGGGQQGAGPKGEPAAPPLDGAGRRFQLQGAPTRTIPSGQEVPGEKTPTTPQEIHGALEQKAGKAADILFSQVMLETGNGKNMFRFNVGNMKPPGKYTGEYQILGTGEGEGGKNKANEPFLAFKSLEEGIGYYVDLLKRKYPKAYEAAEAGDVASFNRELKAVGYYTDNEEKYGKALAGRSPEAMKISRAPAVTPTPEPLEDEPETDG